VGSGFGLRKVIVVLGCADENSRDLLSLWVSFDGHVLHHQAWCPHQSDMVLIGPLVDLFIGANPLGVSELTQMAHWAH